MEYSPYKRTFFSFSTRNLLQLNKKAAALDFFIRKILCFLAQVWRFIQ